MYRDEDGNYVTPRIDDDERVRGMLQGHARLVRTQSYPSARIRGGFQWLRPLTLEGEDYRQWVWDRSQGKWR
jgi:hypothetical protein